MIHCKKSTETSLGMLYFELHIVFTTPLYLAVLWKWYNCAIFLSLMYLSSKSFDQIVAFSNDSSCLYINGIAFFFLKLIIFIACSLMELQNLFMQFSPLYTWCLFSTLWNVHIEDIEYQQGIFSQIFRIIFRSIYFSKHRFKICINNRWCLIRFCWLTSNTLVTSEHIRMLQKPLLWHIFFVIVVCSLFYINEDN